MGAIYTELQQAGVQFELGPTYLDHLERYDVVFRAPGMYYNHPKLQEARQNGVVITTEMEVFLEFCPCRCYAVTGSDGKTTTTTLISEFFKNLVLPFIRAEILAVHYFQSLKPFRKTM